MIPILPIIPLLLQNSCTSSLQSFFSSGFTAWTGVATAGVLAVIFVLSIVYVISPMIGRSDLRIWVRNKIYDALFSLFLIAIFSLFSTMMCSINPVSAYNGAGLLPNSTPINCLNADNLYQLADCDLYSFNNNVLNYASYTVFEINTAFEALPPTVSMDIQPVPGVSHLGVDGELALGVNGLASYFPLETMMLSSLILINEIQLILLDASLILFGILLAIGLIARIFGVSKSFGGSMIALGLGLGFVFPLMVSITYGLIDNMYNLLLSGISNTFFTIIPLMASALLAIVTNGIGQGIFTLLAPYVEMVGYAVFGALFIPFLNFIIIDSFVVDMSSVIGERLDFMSLLVGMV